MVQFHIDKHAMSIHGAEVKVYWFSFGDLIRYLKNVLTDQ